MSDPRVEQLKLALSGEQSGGGLDDIRVYMGSTKQVGQGLGDLLGHWSIRSVGCAYSDENWKDIIQVKLLSTQGR